ncbi:GNAT family N-acetyltransferase [Bacillus massiliigorillae]|uniref:GNAT family N-acetyltransferase n=1 Tax=Bacillus massiliigorillae TaxID=1243664 RepID=UPI0003A88083|nr:GNAT family N-acetyltransferase [Bacillus massiliigorillae]
MTLVIRRSSENDIPQLTDLMYQYIVDFYKRPSPPVEDVHAIIHMLLEGKEGLQYVAERDGQLVGFVTLYFTYSTTKASKIAVMNDLFAVEQERGTGVAQQLFASAENYTKENGYAYMSWITATDNHRAQRFYDKVGGAKGDWFSYSI